LDIADSFESLPAAGTTGSFDLNDDLRPNELSTASTQGAGISWWKQGRALREAIACESPRA